MMSTLFTILTSVAISVGAFFGISNEGPRQEVTPEIRRYVSDYVERTLEKETLGSSVQPIAGVTYNLSGNGVTAAATSITLQSLTLSQTGQELVDSDFSDTFYVTLEPGHRTKQEIVSCTTVTQSAGTTAVLSGCTRGLSPITPYTASTTLAFTHAGGSTVIFSDPPQLFNQYAAKANDETITGQWTFSTFPITATNATSSETIAGVVELATLAEVAANTQTGATGGRLAISTSIATTTWNSDTAGGAIPAASSVTKKIDNGFLATSTMFSNGLSTGTTTITGNLSITGTSTVGIASTSAFTASFTYTKPSNLKYLVTEVVGGGGGGGGEDTASRGGGGGGGGGYCKKTIQAATVGATETVTVGAGGTAGAAADGQGGTGGTSSFGSHCSSTGGTGGTNAGTVTGTGGIGSSGNINVQGGAGVAAMDVAGSIAGNGGSSVLGGGGNARISNGAGNTGGVYGGGGGGGYGNNTGGVGGVGVVILTEVFY